MADKYVAPLWSFSFYISFFYCMKFFCFIVIYTLTNYLLSTSSIKDVVELLDNSLKNHQNIEYLQ